MNKQDIIKLSKFLHEKGPDFHVSVYLIHDIEEFEIRILSKKDGGEFFSMNLELEKDLDSTHNLK